MTKNTGHLCIDSREIKYTSERFKIERLSYRLDDSDVFAREVIRHPGAVVILAIDEDGSQFFVRQPRLALEKELIELPAGTRNQGEEPLECAKRELAEEVGLAATEWLSLGHVYPAPGFCDEQLFLFVAKGLSGYQLPADEDERIIVTKFSPYQINEMIVDGTLQDSKSLALLFKAKVMGLW